MNLANHLYEAQTYAREGKFPWSNFVKKLRAHLLEENDARIDDDEMIEKVINHINSLDRPAKFGEIRKALGESSVTQMVALMRKIRSMDPLPIVHLGAGSSNGKYLYMSKAVYKEKFCG